MQREGKGAVRMRPWALKQAEAEQAAAQCDAKGGRGAVGHRAGRAWEEE